MIDLWKMMIFPCYLSLLEGNWLIAGLTPNIIYSDVRVFTLWSAVDKDHGPSKYCFRGEISPYIPELDSWSMSYPWSLQIWWKHPPNMSISADFLLDVLVPGTFWCGNKNQSLKASFPGRSFMYCLLYLSTANGSAMRNPPRNPRDPFPSRQSDSETKSKSTRTIQKSHGNPIESSIKNLEISSRSHFYLGAVGDIRGMVIWYQWPIPRDQKAIFSPSPQLLRNHEINWTTSYTLW